MLTQLKSQLMHLHTPAKVYVILAVIAMILNFMFMSWHHMFFSALFIVAWALFIEYVGKKGYQSAGWFLAILPFAFMFYAKSVAMNRMIASVASTMTTGMSGSSSSQSKSK